MFEMTQRTKTDTIDKTICQKVNDEELNLTELFAVFVQMTQLMGYYPESWNNLIKKMYNYEFDSEYNIYEWASDTTFCSDLN